MRMCCLSGSGSAGALEMNDWLLSLNIKLSYLLAGTAGGIVRAFLIGTSFYSACASVIIGTLTANYMTSSISQFYGSLLRVTVEPNFQHGVAFVIGLTAMLICEGLLRIARKWAKNPVLPKGGV